MAAAPQPNVLCIGAGRLGALSMLCLAARHPNRIFTIIDTDTMLINAWNSANLANLPVHEPNLHNLINQRRGVNVFFQTWAHINANIHNHQIIFLAIEMNSKVDGVGKKSLLEVHKWKQVLMRIRNVALVQKIVIDKSTVPFNSRNDIMNILNGNANLQHRIIANPEFFSQGTAIQHLMAANRTVVYGPKSPNCNMILLDNLYNWQGINRIVIGANNFRAGDFVKIFNNVFLGVMAVLSNVGSSCADCLDFNIDDAMRVLQVDPRLGRGFLTPNVAVGGPTMLRDIAYIAYMAEEYNMKDASKFLTSVLKVNKTRKADFVKRMLADMHTLHNTVVVILGFAFKAGTEDISDSPAIDICNILLKEERVRVRIYDPLVSDQDILSCFKNTYHQQQRLTILPDIQNIAANWNGVNALCVLTRCPEFHQNINFNVIGGLMTANPVPYFFDFTGDANFNLQVIRAAGFQAYSAGHH